MFYNINPKTYLKLCFISEKNAAYNLIQVTLMDEEIHYLINFKNFT